ncbi:sulfide/dihydroorotate dehydrogenase-like FAD/NAD-binding protein [Candidatus Omnitrophota bacterium]
MHKIIFKQELAPSIKKIVLEAPLVAAKLRPGEFIVIVVEEKGERVPLTVVETDKNSGTLTIIFQEAGQTTLKLGSLNQGDRIAELLGPLGQPTEIKKFGSVVTIGGGVGIAEVYPVTRALKLSGNKIVSIIGARNKGLLILEDRMRATADQLMIATDDGSCGRKGFVSDVLQELLGSTKMDLVYAVGPVAMMRKVAELTKPLKIKTLVSLNPIMVDATGMCGSCRVCVDGQSQFACVDGPEFDGHLVDFTELENRLKLFSEQEKQAVEKSK